LKRFLAPLLVLSLGIWLPYWAATGNEPPGVLEMMTESMRAATACPAGRLLGSAL
jgi:hypothetical protein